eukprot:GHVO01045649.1.p1 GENE.GHVO01045649.1~~GHVO01045649.1.p1  ORF type:complete len:360 (+),score=45.49 GHVO01045649.1:67-1146(+)
MSQTKMIEKYNILTPRHPDCIDACSIDNELFGTSACGIYRFDDESKIRRKGGIFFVSLARGESEGDVCVERTSFFAENKGIPDLRWINKMGDWAKDSATIAAITTDCDLSFYKTEKNGDSTTCESVYTLPILDTPGDYIGLGLEMAKNTADVAACTISNGIAATVALSSGIPRMKEKWVAHEKSEVWAVAIADENVVATGADDCAMKLWDTRMSHEPASVNKREHESGVTALYFSGETTLLSGSYDERIRIWDRRSLARPVTDFKSIGGVWRIRENPKHPNHLLVSGCYGGCQELSFDGKETLAEISNIKAESTSLFYGIAASDISKLPRSVDHENMFRCDSDVVRLSCSFFERRIALW